MEELHKYFHPVRRIRRLVSGIIHYRQEHRPIEGPLGRHLENLRQRIAVPPRTFRDVVREVAHRIFVGIPTEAEMRKAIEKERRRLASRRREQTPRQ